jgi:hypothetical protein
MMRTRSIEGCCRSLKDKVGRPFEGRPHSPRRLTCDYRPLQVDEIIRTDSTWSLGPFPALGVPVEADVLPVAVPPVVPPVDVEPVLDDPLMLLLDSSRPRISTS